METCKYIMIVWHAYDFQEVHEYDSIEELKQCDIYKTQFKNIDAIYEVNQEIDKNDLKALKND